MRPDGLTEAVNALLSRAETLESTMRERGTVSNESIVDNLTVVMRMLAHHIENQNAHN